MLEISGFKLACRDSFQLVRVPLTVKILFYFKDQNFVKFKVFI